MQMKFNVPPRKRSSISCYYKYSLNHQLFSHPRDFLGDSVTQTQSLKPQSPCWCPGTGGPGEELEQALPAPARTQPGQGEAEAARAPLCSLSAEFPCSTYGKSWCSQFTKYLQSICLSGRWCTCHATFCQPVIGCTDADLRLAGDTSCSRVWSQLCKSLQANRSAPPSLNFMLCGMETTATIFLLEGIVKTTVWGAHGALEIGKKTFNSALLIVLLFYITLDTGISHRFLFVSPSWNTFQGHWLFPFFCFVVCKVSLSFTVISSWILTGLFLSLQLTASLKNALQNQYLSTSWRDNLSVFHRHKCV